MFYIKLENVMQTSNNNTPNKPFIKPSEFENIPIQNGLSLLKNVSDVLKEIDDEIKQNNPKDDDWVSGDIVQW